MTRTTVHQQFHGYRKGHQLLSASLVLDTRDQDAVDNLSDLTGRLRPGETFDPYLTAYPLPSRTYYVLARTFQDLEAPRSGCVQTRSLFVPMEAWGQLEGLACLLATLVPIQEGEEAQPQIKPTDEDKWLTAVGDARIVELVQALFFGEVRPIVVFNAPEAELIATRLLVALWPGLRRSFSICTLALGPRRLGEGHFDLVFAPITARSRFSGEAFGRIGVRGSIPSETVHPLAASTAARVFLSDEPRLAKRDILDLMPTEPLCDRTAVRIVIQGGDLVSRVETTPTAVLGMLDILNSRGGPDPEGWDRLSSIVSGALDVTIERSSHRESWKFLSALDAKIEWSTAPQDLVGKLEGVAGSLSRDAPAVALSAVEDLDIDVDASAFILKALGDGVAESRALESVGDWLNGLAPDTQLVLLDASTRMSETLASEINTRVDGSLDTAVHLLGGESTVARRRVRRRLLSLVGDAVALEVIPRILATVEGNEVADLAVAMGCQGKLHSEVMTAALAKAARKTGSVDVVRDAVVSHVPSEDAGAFLRKLVKLTPSDVEWLLGVGDRALAARLLTSLLTGAEERAIQSALSEGDRARRVVSTLRTALPTSASGMTRMLLCGLLPSHAGLDIGFDILEAVPTSERRSLERWLLRATLTAAPLRDPRTQQAIAEFRHGFTPEELVAAATEVSIGPRRVSENLVVLNAAPREVRDGIVRMLDTLVRHVFRRGREQLDEAAYRALAEMFADASHVDSRRRTKVAGTLCAFAWRHMSYPVSALVVTAFPTVYRESGKRDGARRNVFAIWSHAWASGKRPKDGRRQLIDTLVSAFLRSSWPPADLIVTALDANIEEPVMKRIRRERTGARYIDRIAEDAERLDKELRRRVLTCIEDTD